MGRGKMGGGNREPPPRGNGSHRFLAPSLSREGAAPYFPRLFPPPSLPPPFPFLLADDFNQDSFLPAAVEFPIEDLFPWAEVQFPFGDCDHNFAAHHLTLDVGV